jgi:glycosyltransferase involved in cell wall biosynthesis
MEYVYKVYGIFAKVNYLGVDIERFKPLPLPKENMVLAINTSPHKAPDFVIRSLAILPESVRPKLAIVTNGAPQEKEYMYKLAEEYRVMVEIVDKPDDSEIVNLYNKALVTICAYIMEPFGLVPLESMACGTPVIAVKEGGLRETVVHQKTGLLVDRNTQLLAQALSNLLENGNLREEYGKNAREYVIRNWTWQKSIKQLEEYLMMAAKEEEDVN